MMNFQDDIDFTTLNWIKAELDATLDQARIALEAHVDAPADAAHMREVARLLHQVHGTLRMVELYGAALVVEEMERVTQGLVDRAIRPNEDVYAVLMRGIVQLPDYLERLQSGHKDIPIILLPLLNDLRAARGEKLLSESVLFTPDLTTPLPPVAAAPAAAGGQRAEAQRLRGIYQFALLQWIRDNTAAAPLERMSEVLDRLYATSTKDAARRLWWIANGVLDGVRSSSIVASVAIKLLFGKVDREIKRLVDEGEAGFAAPVPRDLAKNLLYYLANTRVDTPRAAAIGRLYRLDSLLPSSAELEHAQGSISGHNRALLDTVAAAIKEDLLHVKEALDVFLRAPHASPDQFSTQTETLDRVADTLGMLALGEPRRHVAEQRNILGAIASGMRKADEATLLDVAGALLYVEASLDDHIARLGAEAPAPPAAGFELPRAEVGRILDALMREAAANIAQTKHDIVAFVEAPWDHARVEQTPRLLEEVSGALDMLGLHDAAQLIIGIVRFVEIELLQLRRVPNQEQLDTLADALASIEYYIEATREHRAGRGRILDITRGRLAALNYWPLPAGVARTRTSARTARDDPFPASTPTFDEAALRAASIDLAARSDDVPATTDTAPPAVAGLEAASVPSFESTPVAADAAGTTATVQEADVADPDAVNHGIEFGFASEPAQTLDSEIRDIFLEEADEEIGNLNQQLPIWRSQPDDFNCLKAIRRSFHTLKGSGRLVGAQALGDFAWKIENMLNRVLDRTIAPNAAAQALVGHAVAALPDLAAALRGRGRPAVDIVAIGEAAERIASGDEVMLDAGKLRPRKPAAQSIAAAAPSVAADAAEAAFEAATPAAQGLDLPQLDPLLFEVLRTEVEGHLGTIDAFAAAARATPMQVTPALLRATHTLNGAITMVDLPGLGSALMALEDYVKRLQAWQQAPDEEGLAALAEVSHSIRTTIAALERGSTALPELGALSARIGELRDALPEPELLESLLAAETLSSADEASLALEATPPAHFDAPDSTDLLREQTAAASPPPADAPRPDEAAAHPSETRIDAAAGVELVPVDAREVAASIHGAAATDAAASMEVAALLDDEAIAAQTALAASSETSHAADAEPVAMPAAEPSPLGALPIDTLRLDQPGGDQSQLEPARSEPAAIEAVADAGGEAAAALDAEAAAHAVPALDNATVELAEPATAPAPIDAAPAAAPLGTDLHSSEAALPVDSATPETLPESAPEAATPSDSVVPARPAAAPIASAPPRFDVSGPEYPPPPLDDDLLVIFVQEAQEILDHADALMARLRETPGDRELIAGLQRDLHTVKGGAHMSGLTPIGDLGHALESLLEAIMEHRRDLGERVVEALEAGFDRLHALVQRVAQRQSTMLPVALIAHVEQLVQGDADPAPSAWVGGSAEPAIGRTAGVAAAEYPPPSPALPTAPGASDEDPARGAAEHIRVRADLLDTMVNTAGEVAIYRSRLEQQIAGYRHNLVELDATVARLREQLRKLELETEAQILSRYQRADEQGLSSFDPLELDRFSQLQQLSRSLSESVSDLGSIQGTFEELTRQAETLLLQQSRMNSDLQEGLMRTRMVPFESMVPALRRTLRQSAGELGKRAQLKVEGAQGEMDRNLLERMKAPFEHMLRNALAHGIEAPEQRIAANKPADGTVSIALSREATEVVLRVSDDGQGLDRDAIRRRAIERGLLAADAAVSDRDLYAYILDSGFSTAPSVTQIAGRGVGMDVVNKEIKQLGGSLAIDSAPGAGASFTVRLPFTLAVTQAILVRLGEASYAIPMSAVQGVVRIARDDLDRRMTAADANYAYAGETFAIHALAGLLGVQVAPAADEGQVPLLMTRSGEQRAAVRVDAVLGSREIVVKSVGPQISSVPGILGATIMGDGSVVMILDLAPLLRRAAAVRAQGVEAAVIAPAPAPLQRRRTLIMVVDDSITMRKATSRVLERQDMDVVTAKDGLDAVEKLQDHIPDLVVLDIEMPRMDGYEFATYMKNDPRTRGVPIIMVTSRTGEKHRARAREIGVERYLGKPYQEAELLQNISEALGGKP